MFYLLSDQTYRKIRSFNCGVIYFIVLTSSQPLVKQMLKVFTRLPTAGRRLANYRHLSSKATDAATVVDDRMFMSATGPLDITNELSIVNTADSPKWPVFRMMKPTGQLEEGVAEPSDLTEELAVKMYKQMIQLQVFDDIMYNAQRQGRISFYMQAAGEEAITIGNKALVM